MAESTEPRPNPRSHHILPPGLSKRALTPPLLLGGQPLLPRGRRRSRRRAACPRPRPARPLGRRPRWAEAARVTWARRPPGARSRGRGWHICPSWPRSPQWPPANEASATRRPTRRRRGPRAPPAPSLKPRWAGAPDRVGRVRSSGHAAKESLKVGALDTGFSGSSCGGGASASASSGLGRLVQRPMARMPMFLWRHEAGSQSCELVGGGSAPSASGSAGSTAPSGLRAYLCDGQSVVPWAMRASCARR
mmetsp:Transcript_5210/g.15536  ORF Transcript_5210/g.15536 Transcript_5210/m.15536 type:complete len:249 (-) Transcript_5210:754-1500(-)